MRDEEPTVELASIPIFSEETMPLWLAELATRCREKGNHFDAKIAEEAAFFITHLRDLCERDRDRRQSAIAAAREERTTVARSVAFARELGVISSGVRNSRYPRRIVVNFFCRARIVHGSWTYHPSELEWAIPPGEALSYKLPDKDFHVCGPLAIKAAIKKTSEVFGFPSVKACKQFLKRAARAAAAGDLLLHEYERMQLTLLERETEKAQARRRARRRLYQAGELSNPFEELPFLRN
jgi:hypothetical protein